MHVPMGSLPKKSGGTNNKPSTSLTWLNFVLRDSLTRVILKQGTVGVVHFFTWL